MVSSPWTPLHAQLHRSIRQRQLFCKGDRLLIGVSGGQDSLCLAQLLLDLQPKWGWELAIAHCNHRWRPDAGANADYVRSLAESWGIPVFIETATDSPASEAAARAWRYDALGAIARSRSYTHVVTGHTMSDRAETLLYNLVRGSGADGLQSLTWLRKLCPGVVLVRPLLEVRRAETAAFCQSRGLRVWEDSTNQDLRHPRNRIRQDILPALQAHLNPQVEAALAHTAELLRADVDYLEATAADLLHQALPPAASPNDCPKLHRPTLQAAALALQRRALRQFLARHLPAAPGFEPVEKLLSLLDAPNRSQTDPFPGGAIARVAGDWIEFVESTKSAKK
ncbi:MAG: tRNA lysidine(34) synthetase TilS [Cyanobacteriota bacterium]